MEKDTLGWGYPYMSTEEYRQKALQSNKEMLQRWYKETKEYRQKALQSKNNRSTNDQRRYAKHFRHSQ